MEDLLYEAASVRRFVGVRLLIVHASIGFKAPCVSRETAPVRAGSLAGD